MEEREEERVYFHPEGWAIEGGAPVLHGMECGACGGVYFPAVLRCPRCFGKDLRERDLSRSGRLYSYSIIHVPPAGFTAPYAVGYVDLPEGVRVFGQLVPDDFANLRIDMEMELVTGVIRRNPDGREVVGYQFRPAAAGPVA